MSLKTPIPCIVAHVDSMGEVISNSLEWRAFLKKTYADEPPPRSYVEIWDAITRGTSGVSQELNRCLAAARATDACIQTVITFWPSAGDCRCWHISLQREDDFPGDETPDVIAIHTDISGCIPDDAHSNWAEDLTALLGARGDSIVFEHDLEGRFTRFEGAQQVLGYGADLAPVLRLDRLVSPETLSAVLEKTLAMHEKPGWTAVYDTDWIAADGSSKRRVRIASRMVSGRTHSLTIRGIAQLLS